MKKFCRLIVGLSVLCVLVLGACAPTTQASVPETAVPQMIEATVTAAQADTQAPATSEPTEAATVAPEATVAPTEAPTQAAASYPVTIENCGMSITYTAAPKRAVTMNQAATEIMLALGLQDTMAGTAYLDDVILPDFEQAYAKIPVLAKEYPSQEVLLNANPDFVFGVYKSAFGDKAAGSRQKLLDMGINSYLSVDACDDAALRPATTSFDILFGEIRDLGKIFGVEDRAEALIQKMQGQLDDSLASLSALSKGTKVFWYDSDDKDSPYAGACCGTPAMVMGAVGVKNVFDDVEGTWADVSWEKVIERNPDVIVVIDASWSPAQDKINKLKTDPTYASMNAVKNGKFIVLPFSDSTLGVRNVQAVVDLAASLLKLK